jgi:hypothetical protein
MEFFALGSVTELSTLMWNSAGEADVCQEHLDMAAKTVQTPGPVDTWVGRH